MSKVVVRRAGYAYGELKPLVFEILEALGVGTSLSNARVLLKPNLLAPASPDKAMLTHPLVVRAVVEYVLDHGGKPQISDSQAMGSFDKILKESGLREALKGLDVAIRELKDPVPVVVGEPFHRIELARDVLDADVVINLPKLKSHGQMLLTLGVKNLFGCVVGFSKPQWHFRTGIDREMFARLLVMICKAVGPAVTLLDGILAMEGLGPGRSGTPRHVGVLMGSRDAAAVDVAVCRMLGLAPESLLTNRMALEAGLMSPDVEIEGDEWSPIVDFKFPDITPLVFGPSFTHSFLRRHLVQRPVARGDVCAACGECWRYCPAGAISKEEGRDITFDYEKCIRCYCCIEVCPHGALTAEEPRLGMVVGRFMNRGRRKKRGATHTSRWGK